MKTWTVYSLYDPRTSEHPADVRYVGVTELSPSDRLFAHVGYACKYPTSRVTLWIRELLSKGVCPAIRILAVVISSPDEFERHYIGFYRDEVGANLLNETLGGPGVLGYRHSEDTLKRMSESNRGKKRSPEARANIRAARLLSLGRLT